ncbi:MAG: CCA tRNA nucleotidyltransferase [Candidatus Thermoplasmatota archaeon]|nr:CCA tRNA nucleotidyltransferase [Candidatus Thermoplasmatota archaeon]
MIPGSKHIETIVLKKITPTPREKKQLENVIQILKEKVRKEISKTTLPITLELVGSTAKDTFIRTSLDIDLFLLFPAAVPREVLQEKGLAIGRAILENQEECYAEHPYLRGTFRGYKTELVPCYKIEDASQKLSAVDRTPLHTTYIKKHLKNAQKKEVRLFKQFLKGIGCYGAEAEIEGFSGYLCEILVLKYGSFQKVVEGAGPWGSGEKLALTPGSYLDFATPLVFIDPVDSERNVASALSQEQFNLFITACQEYRKCPRLTFFFPKKVRPWSFEKIKKELGARDVLAVRFPKPEIIPENLFPQVRKAVRAVRDLCEHYDFLIEKTSFTINQKYVYILLYPKTMTLSKTVLHTGPPVALKKNADEFLNKWLSHPRTIKKPYEKDKRWYVEIEREYTDITILLKEQVQQQSLGKNIDRMIQRECKILQKDDLFTEDLRVFWTNALDKRRTWER